MKSRCKESPHKNRKYYYDKGIRVCERWNRFQNFYEDMYSSYLEHASVHGEPNTTLDRIDNKKDYTFENCRWATYAVQASHLSGRTTYKGETSAQAQKRLGGSPTLISMRMRLLGWSKKDAFTKPVSKTGNRTKGITLKDDGTVEIS